MYLDSSVVVKLFVREPDSLFYAERVNAQSCVWSSQLALTECWSAFYRKNREGALNVDTLHEARSRLEAHIADRTLRLQPVGEAILRRANRLIERCSRQAPIRTLDAIHLATCDALDAFPLLTSDRTMRAAAETLGFELGPLPHEAGM